MQSCEIEELAGQLVDQLNNGDMSYVVCRFKMMSSCEAALVMHELDAWLNGVDMRKLQRALLAATEE